MHPATHSRPLARITLTVSLLYAAMAAGATPLRAETVRVGLAAPRVFSFSLVEVGTRSGMFARHGLDVEITAFGGGPRLVQAMTADGIDVGLDTGPDMALIAKGAPVTAVAAVAGAPLELAIVVRPDGPKTVAELKGKRIGVTAASSLTGWLVTELSRRQGWGSEGILLTPTSSPPASWALMKAGQIDGMVLGLAPGMEGEQRGEARILVMLGEPIQDFHNFVIFATNKVIAARPETVRAFLAGWFDTIRLVRSDKARTVEILKQVMDIDAAILGRAYDAQLPMYSLDGKFDPKALAVLSRSYVDMGILDKEPDMRKLYTEEFLPK